MGWERAVKIAASSSGVRNPWIIIRKPAEIPTTLSLEVTPAQVEARMRELDAQVRASGEAGGLEAYIEAQGVDRAVFSEFLRLGMVQETLARRALGLPPDRPINAEQQEMWLDQVVVQRGTLMPPPPWDDGVAARCGDLAVSVRDYTLFLRTQLPVETLRDTASTPEAVDYFMERAERIAQSLQLAMFGYPGVPK